MSEEPIKEDKDGTNLSNEEVPDTRNIQTLHRGFDNKGAVNDDNGNVHIDITDEDHLDDSDTRTEHLNVIAMCTKVDVQSDSNQKPDSPDSMYPVLKPGPEKRRPDDFIVPSCFVIFCCNFVIGLIGYHFGEKSKLSWKLGDESTARKRSRIAMILIVAGVIVGMATYALTLGLYFSSRYDRNQ